VTHSLITFLTDYGWSGGYVAACEALIAALAPDVRVLHLTHEVPLADVSEAARVLVRVAPLGPVAIHLAVIDPGVGTSRRALVVVTGRGDRLVGPDNGILIPAAEALGGLVSAWALDLERVRTLAGLPATISRTFHGRDVFSPAAALLSRGLDVERMADPIDAATLARLTPPVLELGPDLVRAEVIEADSFGNVGLAPTMAELPFLRETVRVEVEGEEQLPWTARPVGTFADLASGELGILADSWGQASLVLNGASAAELLGATRGSVVRLAPTGPTEKGTRR
jgi:S-adenosylmethionine hydrolase